MNIYDDAINHSFKEEETGPRHLESIDRLHLPVGKLGHKSHLPEKYLEGAFDNDDVWDSNDLTIMMLMTLIGQCNDWAIMIITNYKNSKFSCNLENSLYQTRKR